jgi:hypothetical protein
MTMTNSENSAVSRPEPGEFRVARFGPLPPRLVLVLSPLPQAEAVIAMLVSDEVENATHRDVRVDSDESGLAYPVLVQTDVVAPLWDGQLDAPLGRLRDDMHVLLQPRPELTKVPGERTGPQLPGPWDERWGWKEDELDDLNRLSANCFQVLAEGDEVDRSERTEPALLGAALVRSPAAWPHPVAAVSWVAVADLLGGDGAPMLGWRAEDVGIDSALRQLVSDESIGDDSVLTADIDVSRDAGARVASAVRGLAVAEARDAVTDSPIWTIDRALATLDLREALDELGAPTDAGEVFGALPELLHEAMDALEAALLVLVAEDWDFRDELLDRLEPLVDAVADDDSLRQRYDAWRREYSEALAPQVVPVAVPDYVYEYAAGDVEREQARDRKLELPWSIVASGLADERAKLELRVTASETATVSIRLPLAKPVAEALSSIEESAGPERSRAELLLSAVSGRAPGEGPALPDVWVHLLDPETGRTVERAQLEPGDLASALVADVENAHPGWLGGERRYPVFLTVRSDAVIDLAFVLRTLLVEAGADPHRTVAVALNLALGLTPDTAPPAIRMLLGLERAVRAEAEGLALPPEAHAAVSVGALLFGVAVERLRLVRSGVLETLRAERVAELSDAERAAVLENVRDRLSELEKLERLIR